MGSKFIDLGCGLGLMLYFSPKKSVGIDINEYNVDYVSKRNLNAKLISQNGKFPLEDSSYPSLLCDNVIEHIENPTELIKEIKRVLINNGNLLIGVPMDKGFLRDSDHKIFYDLEKLKEVFCKENNFKLNYYFYFPIPLKIAGKYLSNQTLYISLRNIK